jgi:protein-L-isoaspartate(D-aspartate) O-methyltransferase
VFYNIYKLSRLFCAMKILKNKKQVLIRSLGEKGFSKPILSAFSKVKREGFVPESLKERAYDDTALPIGKGQTISQPYTIALMLKMLDLKKGQKVLEVGSGCGYALALLSEVLGRKGRALGIEIIPELFKKSKTNLGRYVNAKTFNRNGNLGLEEEAPFDRILVSARTEKIPNSLVSQLKETGIIVAPIGSSYAQSLIAFRKEMGKLRVIEEIPGFAFVPLVD